jgi:protein ImuB
MTIAAACPAARALGLQPGMAVSQARALVPGLELRDAEPEADAAFLSSLALFAVRRWTPRAAVAGEDGLWLDLAGVAHLFGGEQRMCARILRFCARLGLAARIAVADTPGAAHALARYGPDELLICASGAEADAIAPLPIAALRIEEKAITAARRLGIDRIGDLLVMPRGPLGRRFGHSLLTRLDQALGRAGEAIEPIVPEDPPSVQTRFLEPIATAEAIGEALRHLMTLLIADLARRGIAGRGFLLRCSRVDGDEQRIAIGTARATRDAAHLLSLLSARIERIEPGFGIEAMRLIALRCEPLAPAAIGNGLTCDDAEPDLAPLIDRLANRLGANRIFRLDAVESDVPERSLRRVPPLEKPQGWPDWPRPVCLLARPEMIEQVVALLPDGPPRRFIWRGETHVVRQADGPERIYGEWWRRRGETEAVRDYFQIENESGARFWIFRRGDGVDPRTGDLSWYLHGVFG